ncbi:MAG: bifunctional folylpolyglutamate synthase/dihydrofolate synthase [Bacteroidetes bacterium]|nr:MAG: bifunctional folylpolyglutamate synthase/dihydrofolate synthase [Bacteroidota bacterium]
MKKYEQTLNYLFSQLPMYQRIGPKAFKKDLNNIILLTNALDKPQTKFPSIHIAGTNGKGSTAFTIAAMFQANGYNTGLYTSPHYKDFRERIRVNGIYVPQHFVIEFVETNKALFEEIKPSFFEISVAMAFSWFARKKVDIAVIETGLGGRLDSTNIVNPLLSIITNISYDHQNFLGDTLPLIAGEKAGIIKPDTPVVIGETHPETKPVFEQMAQKQNAPIYFADQFVEVSQKLQTLEHTVFDVSQNGQPWFQDLKVNLHGIFQQKNLVTALAGMSILEIYHPEFQIEKVGIQAGLEHLKQITQYIGRWQVLQKDPVVLCDSAHNERGLQIVTDELRKMDYGQLHCVLGFVNDKKLDKALAFFPQDARYYFAKADIPRGLDAKILQEEANKFGLKGKAYASVKGALNAAKRAAKSEDLIFVGGSVFTVAEVV